MQQKWLRFSLVILMLASALILIWGMVKDLPYIHEVDEAQFWVEPAARIAATGDLNPHWFGHPGSTVIYPLAAIYRLRYDSLALDVLALYPLNFYLAGRMLSILYAVASIPFIFLCGKKLFNTDSAILGTLFFIFCPQVIYHFQIIRTDSAATFFGWAAIYFIARIYDNPRVIFQVLAGICIGLGISSRYFMVVLLLPLVLANGFQLRLHLRPTKSILMAAGCALLVCLFTFAISSPYFFLDFQAAIQSLKSEARSTHLGADGLSPVGNLFYYIFTAIPAMITWPQALLSLTGLIFVMLRKKVLPLILFTYCLAFMISISLSHLHWARWIIPLLPFFTLAAGYALQQITSQLLNQPKRYLAGLAFAALAVSLLPIYNSVLLDIRASKPGTRILATQWIEKNLPTDSYIIQESYGAILDGLPYKSETKGTLAEFATLEEYRTLGADYLIVSSTMYNRYYKEPLRYDSEVNFYEQLNHCDCMVFEILPGKTQGGPALKIYAIQNIPVP